jgi:predicted nuclease of predicted toxin-antitoxin system
LTISNHSPNQQRRKENTLRILLDENIRGVTWNDTVERLKTEKHDVTWVYDRGQGLRGLEDHQLGRIATEQRRLILTPDKGTFQHENFQHQQPLPYGLVALRLEELSPEARAERVGRFLEQHGEELHNNSTVLEPATERIKPMEQAYQEFQERAEVQSQQSQEPAQTQSNNIKL